MFEERLRRSMRSSVQKFKLLNSFVFNLLVFSLESSKGSMRSKRSSVQEFKISKTEEASFQMLPTVNK